MQQFNIHNSGHHSLSTPSSVSTDSMAPASSEYAQDAGNTVDRTRLRQGIMHVRIRHFYCTLEESFDSSLRGQPFVVGTGMGRPNEPGRVIDASPAAMRLGVSAGMPLRRAHRIAPRIRFLPASYDRYQTTLHQLRERYRAYSRIIESVPIADAFIDLRGCEIPFETPVPLAERLCAEIAQMGLTALIGIANGKTISELAALMSRKDGRQGVLYVPYGREASFVQTLPLSLLLQLRAASAGAEGSGEQEEAGATQSSDAEGRNESFDAVELAELVAHLRDFGITSFVQVANLTEEGLQRRLGRLGSWLYHISNGVDTSLVIPDAPPQSQNARVRFHHPADADETCAAINKLANYLGERLREQRLKGKVIALMLWPYRQSRHDTRRLALNEQGDEVATTTTEDAIGGQMVLSRHTDETEVLIRHALMLFTHYHRHETRYMQVQLRIGDIISVIPAYYPPPARKRGTLTRKL